MTQPAAPYEPLFSQALAPAPGEHVALVDLGDTVQVSAGAVDAKGRLRQQALCLSPAQAQALAQLMRARFRKGLQGVISQEIARLQAELEAM